MKERGVYFAVRILFRVYCCIGCPSSSWSSRGNGRPKYSCLGPGPSPVCSTTLSSFCASSAGCPSTVWEMSVPPDALFFSFATFLLCFLPINERRFMELLLTVNFRVAHLDLCIDMSGPEPSAASPSGDIMMVGSRAVPDHPTMRARPGQAWPRRDSRPRQSRWSSSRADWCRGAQFDSIRHGFVVGNAS